MSELKNTLSSPAWWITAVLVGIVINLVSAYLKTKLDTRLTHASTWWRERSAKRAAMHRAFVEKLKASHHEQVVAGLREIRCRVRSMFLLIMAVLLLILTKNEGAGEMRWLNIGASAFGALASFSSYLFFQEASQILEAIDEATDEAKDSDHDNPAA